MMPSFPRLLAYALPAIPLAALALPMTVIVPSAYARELGVPIAAVGLALLSIRLFDAVTDPLAGVLADRIGGRFRRKLWFLLGIPLVMLGVWMTLVPPDAAGAGHLVIWGFVLSVGTTATALAHQAWGAELATDYHGRNRVAAVREAVTVLGTMLVTALPALLPALGLTTERQILAGIAVLIVLLLPLSGALAAATVPEPVNRSVRHIGLAAGLHELRSNHAFLRLISAFFLNGFANGLPASLFLFYVADRLEAAGREPIFLLIYFLSAVASVPVWTVLTRHVPKHRVWSLAMLLAVSAFGFAVLLPPGALVAFGVICIITGFALGADLILPPSIQADVIDLDTAATGEQRSGLFFALWALAQKAALALAVGLAFPLLALAGFDPAAGQKQESGLVMLALLYAGLPCLLKLGAIALVWRFPIDEAEQNRLSGVISARLD